MQQVATAAERNGRKLAFTGSTMVDNMKMARKLGYLEIPETVVVSPDQALNMKPRDVVLMCTGSQGEPSSILGRLASGTNRLFDIQPGDTVVLSSHPIPGNEEDINRTINRLIQRGATVIYEAIFPVHVSGHASQEEIKLLLHLVRPKFFIPIHGELRHLTQHARLAKEIGIPEENIAVVENGQVIEFENGKMQLAERIPGGYIFVDGSGVGDVGPEIMRERESLARDGVVIVNLTLDKYTNKPMRDPEIISRGFMVLGETDHLFSEARRRISEIAGRAGVVDLKDEIEQTVRSVLYSETKRRPMVFVAISKI